MCVLSVCVCVCVRDRRVEEGCCVNNNKTTTEKHFPHNSTDNKYTDKLTKQNWYIWFNNPVSTLSFLHSPSLGCSVLPLQWYRHPCIMGYRHPLYHGIQTHPLYHGIQTYPLYHGIQIHPLYHVWIWLIVIHLCVHNSHNEQNHF